MGQEIKNLGRQSGHRKRRELTIGMGRINFINVREMKKGLTKGKALCVFVCEPIISPILTSFFKHILLLAINEPRA